GVDEDLERAALLVLGAGVEDDVVDRHVHGVLDQRRFDLVGAAHQHLGALDALVHLDHFGLGQPGLGLVARDGAAGDGLLLVLGADDGVSGDFLVDLDGHDAVPGVLVWAWCGPDGPDPSPAGGRGAWSGYFLLAALRGAAFFAALRGAALLAALRAPAF